MAFVVAEPCIKCKFTDCVDACPADCFMEGANMLVIDPDGCIDCQACVPECPVEAIFYEEDLPAKWVHYIELNRRLAKSWPTITAAQDPLPEADRFRDVQDKHHLLSESPPS